MTVLLVWLAGMATVASIVAFVAGVRHGIDLYETKYYKPRMRKQRDTV